MQQVHASNQEMGLASLSAPAFHLLLEFDRHKTQIIAFPSVSGPQSRDYLL